MILVFSFAMPSFAAISLDTVEVNDEQWQYVISLDSRVLKIYDLLKIIDDGVSQAYGNAYLIYEQTKTTADYLYKLFDIDPNGTGVDWLYYYENNLNPNKNTTVIGGSFFWTVIRAIRDVNDTLNTGNVANKLTTIATYMLDLYDNSNIIKSALEPFTDVFNGNYLSSGESWFSQVHKMLSSIMTVQDNLYAHLMSEDYSAWKFMNSGFVYGTGDFFQAVNNNLYSVAIALCNRAGFNYLDYLTERTVTASSPFGIVGSIGDLNAKMLEYVSRLVAVFANDDDLEFKDQFDEPRSSILDLIKNGITSSEGNTFNPLSSTLDIFNVFKSVNEQYSKPGIDLTSIFKIFDDTSDSLSWFTDETKSNLVGGAVAVSVVDDTGDYTNYYDERMSEFNKYWGDNIG